MFTTAIGLSRFIRPRAIHKEQYQENYCYCWNRSSIVVKEQKKTSINSIVIITSRLIESTHKTHHNLAHWKLLHRDTFDQRTTSKTLGSERKPVDVEEMRQVSGGTGKEKSTTQIRPTSAWRAQEAKGEQISCQGWLATGKSKVAKGEQISCQGRLVTGKNKVAREATGIEMQSKLRDTPKESTDESARCKTPIWSIRAKSKERLWRMHLQGIHCQEVTSWEIHW